MISYAVTVCNEDHEIAELLKFLKRNIREEDEVVVLVDSKNVTPAVLKVLKGHKIHYRDFDGDFAAHKNHMNSLCQGSHIFNIDADEIPSALLVEKLPEICQNDFDVCYVPRVNLLPGASRRELTFLGFNQNEFGAVNWPDMQGRIYRNSPEVQWEGKVHEKIKAQRIGQIEPHPHMSLWHVKSIERQMRQNALYDQLGSINQTTVKAPSGQRRVSQTGA